MYLDADVKRRMRVQAEVLGMTLSDYVRMCIALAIDALDVGNGGVWTHPRAGTIENTVGGEPGRTTGAHQSR